MPFSNPRHTAKGADWIYAIHPPTHSVVDQNNAALSEVEPHLRFHGGIIIPYNGWTGW